MYKYWLAQHSGKCISYPMKVKWKVLWFGDMWLQLALCNTTAEWLNGLQAACRSTGYYDDNQLTWQTTTGELLTSNTHMHTHYTHTITQCHTVSSTVCFRWKNALSGVVGRSEGGHLWKDSFHYIKCPPSPPIPPAILSPLLHPLKYILTQREAERD